MITQIKEFMAEKMESGKHISFSKKSKKLFLALFATLLIVAAIVGVVAGVNSRKNSGNSQLSAAAHAVLKSSCCSTLYSTIANAPGASAKLASQKDVIEASARRRLSIFAWSLETIDETLDELHEAVEDLRLYPNKKSLSLHADDLKILISSAITNQETCLDGFSHDDADKHVREVLPAGEEHVERMCSNALAMIKNMTDRSDTDIANKRKTLNRKLKEDVDVDVDGTRWPEWSSAADRRLLQSSPVTPNVVAAADGIGDHKTPGNQPPFRPEDRQPVWAAVFVHHRRPRMGLPPLKRSCWQGAFAPLPTGSPYGAAAALSADVLGSPYAANAATVG
ncbi:hypothetical protein FH972_017738 [Carpinus fangiana]|uniref:pectinesterase n=1 Tax=Carpinus fangiana TaxID=176857 RepID=A0A5N6RK16_9ROSI|nr:hypothetical protein FH972_017738 [Carpinus fangiana]